MSLSKELMDRYSIDIESISNDKRQISKNIEIFILPET